MNTEKEIENMGIRVSRELKLEEKSKIINDFAQKMINAIKNQKMKLVEIKLKMSSCKMYLAEFDGCIGSANYFYKNQSIYFNEKADYLALDEYSIHECIHYFQDSRERGKLDKIGLCTFSDFRVEGLGLNEAAVQYITSKMLGKEKEEIEYGNIKLSTYSKNYYPLISNLIEQIVYLLGEEELIDSTIYGNEKFQIYFMELCGEKALNNIAIYFDKILELTNRMNRQTKSSKDKEKIEDAYETAQNMIFLSYFDGILPLLETIEEVEEYKAKLEGYKEYMGNVDSFLFYEIYKDKKIEEAEQLITKIIKKNSTKTPMLIRKNIFFEIFNKLKSVFTKGKKEYKF